MAYGAQWGSRVLPVGAVAVFGHLLGMQSNSSLGEILWILNLLTPLHLRYTLDSDRTQQPMRLLCQFTKLHLTNLIALSMLPTCSL